MRKLRNRILALLVVGVMTIVVAIPATAQDNPWSTNVPENGVDPTKFQRNEATEDSCTIPGGCWILAPSGVLSADDYNEANSNPSAVWTGGGDVQFTLENSTGSALLPESGYLLVVGAGMNVQCGDFETSLPAREDHAWFLLMRGLSEGDGDRNTICNFSGYTPGAVLVTVFAIPEQASAFVSQDYIIANIQNAHERKNCGLSGCTQATLFASDVNDGATSVIAHTAVGGWELLWTNTQSSTATTTPVRGMVSNFGQPTIVKSR